MKSRDYTAAAFVNGKKATASNFTTDGQEATSFATVIAAHTGAAILIKDVYTFVFCGERLTGRTPTTERQKAAILFAASQAKKPAFVVPNIAIWSEADHRANLLFLAERAQEAYKKSTRARKEESRLFWQEETERRTKTAQEYRRIYHVTKKEKNQ